MTRLNLLLLLALLASCLVLVQTAYEARRLFTALDRARQQEAQLDTEFKRLDAERQAQATHSEDGRPRRIRCGRRGRKGSPRWRRRARPMNARWRCTPAPPTRSAGRLRK
jgi:cell division protein FtsL